jgi:hypothetical protein
MNRPGTLRYTGYQRHCNERSGPSSGSKGRGTKAHTRRSTSAYYSRWEANASEPNKEPRSWVSTRLPAQQLKVRARAKRAVPTSKAGGLGKESPQPQPPALHRAAGRRNHTRAPHEAARRDGQPHRLKTARAYVERAPPVGGIPQAYELKPLNSHLEAPAVGAAKPSGHCESGDATGCAARQIVGCGFPQTQQCRGQGRCGQTCSLHVHRHG